MVHFLMVALYRGRCPRLLIFKSFGLFIYSFESRREIKKLHYMDQRLIKSITVLLTLWIRYERASKKMRATYDELAMTNQRAYFFS
jgi:hypothetical protein